MTQAVLLENSSKRKHLVENNILRILGRDQGSQIRTGRIKSYRIRGRILYDQYEYR